MSRDEQPTLAEVPMRRLVTIARTAKEKRAQLMRDAGMACAEMYRRGLSWREIGEKIGEPLQTAHRWAKPYLADDAPELPE